MPPFPIQTAPGDCNVAVTANQRCVVDYHSLWSAGVLGDYHPAWPAGMLGADDDDFCPFGLRAFQGLVFILCGDARAADARAAEARAADQRRTPRNSESPTTAIRKLVK